MIRQRTSRIGRRDFGWAREGSRRWRCSSAGASASVRVWLGRPPQRLPAGGGGAARLFASDSVVLGSALALRAFRVRPLPRAAPSPRAGGGAASRFSGFGPGRIGCCSVRGCWSDRRATSVGAARNHGRQASSIGLLRSVIGNGDPDGHGGRRGGDRNGPPQMPPAPAESAMPSAGGSVRARSASTCWQELQPARCVSTAPASGTESVPAVQAAIISGSNAGVGRSRGQSGPSGSVLRRSLSIDSSRWLVLSHDALT